MKVLVSKSFCFELKRELDYFKIKVLRVLL